MITIPVSPELMHHPKTRALACLTGLPRAAAWPKLILFWSYAARYYPAGDVTNLKDDPAELAFALDFPSPDQAASFFSGMLEVGFLDRDDAGRLTIHDWFTQGPGRLLRKQAADRARKRLRAVSAEFPRNVQTARPNPTNPEKPGLFPIPDKPVKNSKESPLHTLSPMPYTLAASDAAPDLRHPINPEKPGDTLPSRAKAKDTCEAGVPWLFPNKLNPIPDTRNPINPVETLKNRLSIPTLHAASSAAPIPWKAIERVLSKHGSARGNKIVNNWLQGLLENRSAPNVCPVCRQPFPAETAWRPRGLRKAG